MINLFKLLLATALISLAILVSAKASPGKVVYLPVITRSNDQSTLSITDIYDNRTDYLGMQIPSYSKLEITFQVNNTVAQNFQLPAGFRMPSNLFSGIR